MLCVFLQAVVPAAMLLGSSKPISGTNKNLAVRLTNILDGELGQFTVTVKSITDPTGKMTSINKPMAAGADK